MRKKWNNKIVYEFYYGYRISKVELTRPEGSRDRLSFFPVIVLVCYVSVLA